MTIALSTAIASRRAKPRRFGGSLSLLRRARMVLLIAAPIMAAGPCIAADWAAASCSLDDVKAAYQFALPGDVVRIPAGTATWGSTLTIAKSLTLSGSGAGSTVITGAGGTHCVEIGLSSDVPVRITGICFKYTSNIPDAHAVYIVGKQNGSLAYTKIRVDHCRFEKGKRAIFASGWVEGVVDHNEFLNCNIAVGVSGDNNFAWERPIEAGTSHALFIEDNTFAITNAADTEPNEAVYHQEGGRTVVRYNTFDATAYTAGNALFYDSHGNQNGYYDGVGDFRGQPMVEVYGNRMDAHHSYRFLYIRGGSVLFYDNSMTTITGGAPRIVLTEQEAWHTFHFSPLRTTWNAEDQIMNSFFWGNTSNSAPINDVVYNDPADATFIQKDRDYFMHPPAATGGRAVYTGRQGGEESFVSTGPNAYYPYSAFAYPHPMTIATALGQPRNLRLKSP